MARFTEGYFYIITKNVHNPDISTETIFFVEELYKERKITRARGPGVYRFINNTLYVGGEIDVIPEAYIPSKDIWKRITKKQALSNLFLMIFKGYKVVIKPEITELERILNE